MAETEDKSLEKIREKLELPTAPITSCSYTCSVLHWRGSQYRTQKTYNLKTSPFLTTDSFSSLQPLPVSFIFLLTELVTPKKTSLTSQRSLMGLQGQ